MPMSTSGLVQIVQSCVEPAAVTFLNDWQLGAAEQVSCLGASIFGRACGDMAWDGEWDLQSARRLACNATS